MSQSQAKAAPNPAVAKVNQLLGTGKKDEAIALCERERTKLPDDPFWHSMLGNVYFHSGNMEQAKIFYQEALNVAQDDANSWNNYGEACREMGLWDEAEQAYEKAFSLQANHASALANLSALRLSQRRVEDARLLAQKAHAIAPQAPAVNKAIAAVLVADMQFGQALRFLKGILQAVPNYTEALLLKVWFHLAKSQLKEARFTLDHILQTRPDMTEALLCEATLQLQLQQPDKALEAAQKAVADKPDFPMAHLVMASVMRNLKRYEEAHKALDVALKLAPEYVDAYALRASLHLEQKQVEEADAALAKAQALAPDHPQVLFVKAGRHMLQGEQDKSRETLQKLLEKTPDFMPALLAQATLLNAEGNKQEAEAKLVNVLEQSPEHVTALSLLGFIYADTARYARAGECLAKALSIGTDNYAVRRGFVDSLRAMKLTEYSEHFEKAIMICLNDPHISKQYLSSSWLVTLQKKPELAEVSALLRNQGGYDRVVKMLKMVRSQPTFADPFFLTGLANIVVGSMYFENMVVYLRRYALMHRKEVESWGWLPLLAALAHQCFMVEYIGEETAEETKHIEVLLQELDAKDSPVADLLLAAAYRPLLGMKDPKAISARLHGEADAEIRRIAREQLDEPLEEQSIVSDIETLGEVSDEISQAVQNQYEENPYPRWTLVTQSARLPFAKVIKALFPFLEEDALPKAEKPRILIPGCGTGKQVISSINRLDSCDVLAVDLSKASLSYAIRKTRELGYDNITFKQADILKLPEVVEGQFDDIECTGVLHHMADPVAGWKILCSMLKPGGFMKIGLYSELARQNVVAARDFIAEQGFEPTKEGIRACRKAIHALPPEHPVRKVETARDYYMLSECRDLIFHVQEHRFTLPQLEKIMDELGLEFLGFEGVNPGVVKQYKAAYPDDTYARNLTNWHAFETEYPGTFFGMYQLWLRRKPE